MNPQESGKNSIDTVARALFAARGFPAPRVGWLKMSRTHAQLSTREVGRRLKVSHQAISQFELAERRGRISLANLRRVAEAMGCELVYGIVPKEKPTAGQTSPGVTPKQSAPPERKGTAMLLELLRDRL